MIVLLGGLGSITGSVVMGVSIAFLMEFLRFVESPMTVFGLTIPGISGMRMLIFALILVITVIFFRRGLFGQKEFSWDWIFRSKRRNAE
jgi:branched-chain amino acid transport system permease protein